MTKPHYYLLGIGGVGMLWIADWAMAQGYEVSGVDTGGPTAATERLAAAGVSIRYECSPEAIPQGITQAVISSAITPTSQLYPELLELQKRGVPIAKRSVITGKITRKYTTITVAGTHGKTTTTAMVGWILAKAGLDPTVFVGGSVAAWGGATLLGKSKYLVIEADEYDRSFHQFSASIAVLLNLEPDHLEYYKGGLAEIEHSFKRFLRNLPHRRGMVVAYGKNKSIRKVVKGFSYKLRWYSEESLWKGISLQLPGKHNLLNATAAARVAHELGVSQKDIISALASFPGVGRRFEVMGNFGNCEWIDDYAHHPTEVSATLQALAERANGKRRVVVFQAHQKARTQLLLKEFGRCFDAYPPEVVILAPIFTVMGRESGIEVSHRDIAEEILRKLPPSTVLITPDTFKELEGVLSQELLKPGVVLTMSAGDLRNRLLQMRRKGVVMATTLAELHKHVAHIETGYSLQQLTPLMCGGSADYFTVAKDVIELATAVKVAQDLQLPHIVLGEGRGTLFADGGFPGLVIHNRSRQLTVATDKSQVVVDAGLPLDQVITACAGRGYGGLTTFHGIGGSLASAILYDYQVGNQRIRSFVRQVTVLQPPLRLDREATVNRYPSSWLYQEGELGSAKLLQQQQLRELASSSGVLLTAVLQLTSLRPESLQGQVAKQLHQAPADGFGPLFKGFDGDAAQWKQLYQKAGVFKIRAEGVKIHPKHSNYLLAIDSYRSSSEILQYLLRIKELIADQTGVHLELVPTLAGPW